MVDASRTEPGTAGQQTAVPVLAQIMLGKLRAVFPQWRVAGRSGVCWAVRGGLVAWDGPQSSIRHVHTAPDPIALAEKLCLQEYRAEGSRVTVYLRDAPGPACHWPGVTGSLGTALDAAGEWLMSRCGRSARPSPFGEALIQGLNCQGLCLPEHSWLLRDSRLRSVYARDVRDHTTLVACPH